MRWGKIVFLSLVIAVALTAFAVGAGKNSSDGIVLCAAKKSGQLTLAGKSRCGKGEKKLVVGKQAPGAPGRQGPPGPAGAAGKPLSLAPEPAHLVGEATGQCKASPGTFCGTPGAKGTWRSNFEAELTYRKDAAGWVYLTGSAMANEGGSENQFDETEVIFYLPPGFRPADGIHRFHVSASSCHNPGYIYYVDVFPNGAVMPQIQGGCVGLTKLVFHP